MRKISFKGVIIGGLTDIVVTSLLIFALMVYAMTTIDLSNTPQNEQASALVSALGANPIFYGLQYLFGAIGSVLGGYTAARLAKRHELLNGILSSAFCIGVSVYLFTFANQQVSLMEQLYCVVSAPIFGLMGGYLASIQAPRADASF